MQCISFCKNASPHEQKEVNAKDNSHYHKSWKYLKIHDKWQWNKWSSLWSNIAFYRSCCTFGPLTNDTEQTHICIKNDVGYNITWRLEHWLSKAIHLSERGTSLGRRTWDLARLVGTLHTIAHIFCFRSAGQLQICSHFLRNRNKWRQTRLVIYLLDSKDTYIHRNTDSLPVQPSVPPSLY